MKVMMTVPHQGIDGPIPKLVKLMTQGLRELSVEVVESPYSRRLATQAKEEPIARKILDRTSDLSKLISQARQSQPDILFANTAQDRNSFLRDLPMALAAKALRLPTVLLYHGSSADLLDQSSLLRCFTKLLFLLTDGLLLLSREEILSFKRYWPCHRYAVVRYPAVIDSPAALAVPDSFPLDWRNTELPTLCFVGRLVSAKGIQELLEAMPIVLQRINCRLAILGEGELDHSLQQRVHDLGLEKDVFFAGYVKDERELQAWYNAATCLVLPTYREGFPVVVLEAMATGLPIVCTRVQGIADHMQEGVHAFFVPPRDPQILATRLIELLQNQSIQAQMADANRELIRQFQPVKVMQEYLNFFEQVLANRKQIYRVSNGNGERD